MPLGCLLACTGLASFALASGGETVAIEKVKPGVGAAAQAEVTVLIRDGRIAAIGPDVAVPPGAERIDGSGLTLLPGFIDGFSELGLAKDERSAATPGNEGPAQDYGAAAYAETAEANRRGLRPELRARDLLAAPDKDAFEKLRQAGFTAVLAAPTSGFIPGQACLFELIELPPRDAVVGEPGMLVFKFRSGGAGGGPPPGPPGPPGPGPGPNRPRREEGDFGYPSTLMGALAHVRQAFLDAQRLRSWRESYRRNPGAVPRPPSDSCLDALLRALDGELRVAFLVDRESEVRRALRLAEEFRLEPLIVGGKEAWKCASELAAARIPVIASLNFPDAPERKNAKKKEKAAEAQARRDAPDGAPGGAPQVIAVAPDAAAGAAPGAPAGQATAERPEVAQDPDADKSKVQADPAAVPPAGAGSKEAPGFEAKAAAAQQAPAASGPSAPAVEEWEVADPVLAEPLKLFEQRRKEWVDEVENVQRLLAAGVTVALTTRGSSGASDFLADLRVAVEHGLDPQAAIAALTSTPAALFRVEHELGSLKPGAAADLILVEGDLSSKERAVRHVFVGGRRYPGAKKKAEGKEGRGESKEGGGEPGAEKPLDLTGTWTLTSAGGHGGHGFKATLTLKQEGTKLSGTLESEMGSATITSGSIEGREFKISVSVQFQQRTFEFTLKGTATQDSLQGAFETPFGEPSEFEAKRGPGSVRRSARAEMRGAAAVPLLAVLLAALPGAGAATAPDGGTAADFETEADRRPSFSTGGGFFIDDATLLTVSHGTIARGDLLVQDGRIAAIGEQLEPPAGLFVLDGRGLFVMPGLIDCHSHAAIEGGVNEGTLSIVPEVRIGDQIDARDPTIWRALAGGTTTMNLLHGSANVVGGQNAVVKLRWGKKAAEFPFEGAPRGVKFALGENPKQSNSRGDFDRQRRYPATRMGVEAALRRAFTRALDYREEWKEYAAAKARGEERLEPRRDLRLEALVDILEGRILVHSHCYRADEILMLLRVAEEFGFRVRTLQHVLEGYKVAPEIAQHGAGPSTFSDWWAYKLEAYDAIPYNAALLALAGCRGSLNSDSADLTRRLYHEAAKTLRYGNLPEQDALAQVTLNPAWQLGVDHRVGSLDVGKDADLAVFNGHPLSVYSRCEFTFVDGECCFERRCAEGEARALNATGPSFGPIDCPDPSQLPLPGNGGVYALVGGTVHPVSGPPIETGVVLVESGRIAAVGADVRVPDHAEVVRCEGLHVYPGLFDAATTLGLGEIGSVPGGQDTSEVGGVEPDLRVTAAIHAASSHVPVTRCDGVTTALVLPGGGAVPGRGSLVQLDGSTWEEMVVADSHVLRLQFPQVSGDDPPEKALEKEEVTRLDELFGAALRYADARAAGIEGLRRAPGYEALLPFVRGEGGGGKQPVVVDANAANQIRAAVLFAEKHGLNYLLLGCSEAWLVADFLKQHGARCLVSGSLGMPRGDQRYDAAFHNAARLHAAGVPFALVTTEQENVRQLGHHAGMAAAFGLPREAALRAVTLAPAELLGVADRYGSLEAGKVASVIVTDGDPLELRTHVRYEFIAGRPIRLVSKQTELYETCKRRILERRGARAGQNPTAAGG